jgi:hypothetical protein
MPELRLIAIAITVLGVGLVVFALVMERRERKRLEDLDRLGLGGRQCRRRRTQSHLPRWFR